MSNYYSFNTFLGSDCLRIFLATEKKPVDIITISLDPSKTIHKIKEENSNEKQIPVDTISIWCICYQNEKSNCDIDDRMLLKHYLEENNDIQYIFARETGKVNIKEGLAFILPIKHNIT